MSFFTWKDEGLTSDCASLDAMASRFEETANLIKKLSQKGKRIFLMTPLHHHFELKGVKEEKIVETFWKINILLVILGIVLKINL